MTVAGAQPDCAIAPSGRGDRSTIIARILKDWPGRHLERQTPGNSGRWANVQFAINDVDRCDYIIVLNRVPQDSLVQCPPENVWALIQEPVVGKSPRWAHHGHDQFARVFTHAGTVGAKYFRSYPALPWLVDKSYDELVRLDVPRKEERCSFIASNKKLLLGQEYRVELLDYIRRAPSPGIDRFGRGHREITDKWDALSHYKYSIAIESTSLPDYWTEKIADCYLSYTLPLYWGCPNIGEYFPEDSFIRIDAKSPEHCVEEVKEAMANDEWAKRLPAIKKARELVLERYNFCSYFAGLINEAGPAGRPEQMRLRAYRPTVWEKLDGARAAPGEAMRHFRERVCQRRGAGR